MREYERWMAFLFRWMAFLFGIVASMVASWQGEYGFGMFIVAYATTEFAKSRTTGGRDA